MSLVTAIWTGFVYPTIVVCTLGWIGFAAHETAHYRAALAWDREPTMKFKTVIPGRVNVSTFEGVTDRGIRFIGVAPTAVFTPLLVILYIRLGVPPLPTIFSGGSLSEVEISRWSILLMVFVAAFPSPADLLIFLKPNRARELARSDKSLGHFDALKDLLALN